jgi:hypothetical protein
VSGGHKVLMEVDDNILLIVGDPQGVLDSALQASPNLFIKYYFVQLGFPWVTDKKSS